MSTHLKNAEKFDRSYQETPEGVFDLERPKSLLKIKRKRIRLVKTKTFKLRDFRNKAIREIIREQSDHYTNLKNKKLTSLDYEYLQKKFINDGITNNTIIQINNIIKTSHLIDETIKSTFPVHKIILSVIKRVLLNEYEILYFALMLDAYKWKSEYFSFRDHLLAVALIVKMNLNEQYKYIFDYLSIKKKNLQTLFETWVKRHSFEFKDFAPCDIHTKYVTLNSDSNQFCKKNFIDYNQIVDQILTMSLPYIDCKSKSHCKEEDIKYKKLGYRNINHSISGREKSFDSFSFTKREEDNFIKSCNLKYNGSPAKGINLLSQLNYPKLGNFLDVPNVEALDVKMKAVINPNSKNNENKILLELPLPTITDPNKMNLADTLLKVQKTFYEAMNKTIEYFIKNNKDSFIKAENQRKKIDYQPIPLTQFVVPTQFPEPDYMNIKVEQSQMPTIPIIQMSTIPQMSTMPQMQAIQPISQMPQMTFEAPLMPSIQDQNNMLIGISQPHTVVMQPPNMPQDNWNPTQQSSNLHQIGGMINPQPLTVGPAGTLQHIVPINVQVPMQAIGLNSNNQPTFIQNPTTPINQHCIQVANPNTGLIEVMNNNTYQAYPSYSQKEIQISQVPQQFQQPQPLLGIQSLPSMQPIPSINSINPNNYINIERVSCGLNGIDINDLNTMANNLNNNISNNLNTLNALNNLNNQINNEINNQINQINQNCNNNLLNLNVGGMSLIGNNSSLGGIPTGSNSSKTNQLNIVGEVANESKHQHNNIGFQM